jgi:hypothetical protein
MEGDSLLCYGSQIALSTFLPERLTKKKRRKLKKMPIEEV